MAFLYRKDSLGKTVTFSFYQFFYLIYLLNDLLNCARKSFENRKKATQTNPAIWE